MGEECYEDWIAQFESIAEINHWNDGQKLMWLKLCLTGRALMACKKFPTIAYGSFKNAVNAKRFEPKVIEISTLQNFRLDVRGRWRADQSSERI